MKIDVYQNAIPRTIINTRTVRVSLIAYMAVSWNGPRKKSRDPRAASKSIKSISFLRLKFFPVHPEFWLLCTMYPTRLKYYIGLEVPFFGNLCFGFFFFFLFFWSWPVYRDTKVLCNAFWRDVARADHTEIFSQKIEDNRNYNHVFWLFNRSQFEHCEQ